MSVVWSGELWRWQLVRCGVDLGGMQLEQTVDHAVLME